MDGSDEPVDGAPREAPAPETPVDDADALSVQLGRRPRAPVVVLRRCGWQLPVVTEVPPVLGTGEPFPTRYWLSCPLAVRRIARLEAAGGVRQAERRASEDRRFGARLAAAHARYARQRDARVPPGVQHPPHGGVGGAREGIKCLHAHYADHAAGNDNPVGASVAPGVEPLDCARPCVVGSPEAARRNPAWREPD